MQKLELFLRKQCYQSTNQRTNYYLQHQFYRTWLMPVQKKIDDDVMSQKDDIIVIFPIYEQFRAIWKLDSKNVCKTYIFINSNLLSYKQWKQN